MEILSVEALTAYYEGKNSKKFYYPDFAIGKGRCLCIKGDTGCGKTTLLKALFKKNFEGKADYKSAQLMGKDIRSYGRDIYRVVSFMPQFSQNALNPSLTVEGHGKDVPGYNREGFLEMLASLKLDEDVMNKYPYELSGGMKQRIVMLLGFLKNPSLYVMDEPSTAIDALTLKLISDFLRRMKEKGISILMVTHDFGFSKHIADEHIILQVLS